MSSIVLNRRRARRVVKNGKSYLVVPLTLIVPGVLNGSNGALYYPPDEVARNHKDWNGVPVTIQHPEQPCRGRKCQSVGFVQDAAVDNAGRLGAEGWLDVAKLRSVAPALYSALAAGKAVDVSTGLAVDQHAASPGSRDNKGRAYTAIARNYRPDHLAILPDRPGACSVYDGCGINV